jgi:AbrB family looped-hinge helix DNA binding protein
MAEYLSDITAVSSKGQVVLPKAIRDKLNIVPGIKLMVFSDGNSILLKPIPEPDISEFRELMDAASSWASDVGMTEEDITSAIQSVRSRRRSNK